jgi:GxxExxY protein
MIQETGKVEVLYPELSYRIVGAAMEVHRALGPGFLEAVYQVALAEEMRLRGISFEREKRLKVLYKGITVGDYQADFVVEDQIILELKAISALTPAHMAQARHYLTATGLRLAILLNFGSASLGRERVAR